MTQYVAAYIARNHKHAMRPAARSFWASLARTVGIAPAAAPAAAPAPALPSGPLLVSTICPLHGPVVRQAAPQVRGSS